MKVALFKFFLLLLTLSLPLVSAVDILRALKGGFNKVTGILDVESSKVRPFSTIDEVGPSRNIITGQEWATILQDPRAGFTTATHKLTHFDIQLLGRALMSFTSVEQSYARDFRASERRFLEAEAEVSRSDPEALRHAARVLNQHAKWIKDYAAERLPQDHTGARRIEEMKLRTPVLWLAHEELTRIGKRLEEGVQDEADLNQLRKELGSTRSKIDSAWYFVGRLESYGKVKITKTLRDDVEMVDELYHRLDAYFSGQQTRPIPL